MARAPRNYGGFIIDWNPEDNSINIIRQYPHSSSTPRFGLGNAEIQLNVDFLPDNELIIPITGETTGEGLLPTSPFKMKRWYGLPENVSMVSKTLTGFNGWTLPMSFPQADGGSIKEVVPVQIIQNGYGCEEIVGDAPRLNW